jgi:hypothetical protein
MKSHMEEDDEQDLIGFFNQEDTTKAAALSRKDLLNRLANHQLGDLYGERPTVLEWARARRNCPTM